MKSLSLFLFAAGASALFAVSCKNSSDDKLLNLKTVTFSFSGEPIPNDYEFVGDVKCTIDSSGANHTEPFTITNTDSKAKYVENSNTCTLKINSIRINTEDYTPETSVGGVQYQFSSVSNQLQTSSHTKSEAVKYINSNSKAHKFFNLTLKENIFTIVMTDYNQGTDITSTSKTIKAKETNNFNYNSIPLPKNPIFSIDKTTITQDTEPTTRFTYKLSAKNPEKYHKNSCKMVTNATLDTRQEVLNAYNSGDAIACPDLDIVTTLTGAQFPTYIILGSKAPDNTDDSFTTYKIN
ncbi:hypothetical protein [Spirobacillus cienkowskii]|uniref:hypothetical protein n=1 Tax=Spirobacillus cienkowskii TaxID=495820 RepID=UPI0030CD099F